MRRIRKGASLTQAQLAQKLGRARSHVVRIEAGEKYLLFEDFCEWLLASEVDVREAKCVFAHFFAVKEEEDRRVD